MSDITIDLVKIRENGIFLMLPVYGGQNFSSFGSSLMQLVALCAQHAIPLETFFIYNESLVQRARNYCADEFLRRKFKRKHEDGSVTEHYYQHGMFIDSDIEFKAIDVLVMAHLQNTNADFDVVCGPYTKKQISWEKVKAAVDKGFADEDPDNLANFAGDFVFNPVKGQSIQINKPAEVHESGTGFMMFRRDTLLKLSDTYPNLKYKPDHARSLNFDGSREISAFFDTGIDPETNRYLSEDYYFCKIVRGAGMKVWLIPWIELVHHGYYAYKGSLAATAMAGVDITVDPSKIKKK